MKAEAVSFVRKFVLMLGAAGFLTAQISLMDHQWSVRDAAGTLSIGGLLLWAGALLWLVGPWLWRSRDRAADGALNDERVRANRGKAFMIGYALTLLAALIMFFLAVTGSVGGAEAAHLIFAVGVAAPMFGFAFLE